VLGRQYERGDEIEVLCLRGEPRSGCPRETVERLLAEHDQRIRENTPAALGFSGVLGCVFCLAARKVMQMHDPNAGWSVLLIGILIGGLIILMYFADEFFKAKRRRFNSATAMQPTKSGKEK